MKYLYTTEPDEGCHKINGVYGRPVHTYEQKALKAKGWTETADELREEGREEKEIVRDHEWEGAYDESLTAHDDREAWAELYEEKFGKKPHHKAKVETIRQKVEDSDD